jgi:hypothetical protein
MSWACCFRVSIARRSSSTLQPLAGHRKAFSFQYYGIVMRGPGFNSLLRHHLFNDLTRSAISLTPV